MGLSRTIALLFALCVPPIAHAADSLPPLPDGRVPQTVDELWSGYDPRREPLEIQVAREWTEDSLTCRYVTFTVGTFKGQPARLAAFYAFPKNAARLPAVLHVHGGGKSAELAEVKRMAALGFAALSINWGGLPIARPGEPETDWGAIDPTQKHDDHFRTIAPDDKTLDAVPSPRNSNWVPLLMAARRSLTFLEQQPEVDASRLGIYGTSMGGKITVDTAALDARVKAAVPSMGGAGVTDRQFASMTELERATIDDRAYFPRLKCPVLWILPSNDFFGPMESLFASWDLIGSREKRVAIPAQVNHRSTPEADFSQVLWFEQHLRGAFSFPKMPELEVKLDTPDGVPLARVTADRTNEIASVEIYYAIDAHAVTRFWRSAAAKRDGNGWEAPCPMMSTQEPLTIFANVSYRRPPSFARNATLPETFLLSSRAAAFSSELLQKAGTKATDTRSLLIEDFAHGWRDWYRLAWSDPGWWWATTRKLKDPKWRGAPGARLLLDVRSAQDREIVFSFDCNGWGAFPGKTAAGYLVAKKVRGSPKWQTISVSLDELLPKDAKTTLPMAGWDEVTEFSLSGKGSAFVGEREVKFGNNNAGWPEPREFRNLRWEN